MRGGRAIRTKGLAILLLPALGACGGADSGSAADRRAALDRWVAKADAACRKSNAAIAERGWPANLVDLDRLSVRAANDVRDAAEQIRRLPPPKGSESRVKPFVGTLGKLDGLLEQVTDTTEAFEPERLTALAPDLQSGLVEVEKASKALGLRECAANDEHAWVPDAIRAPVFAQQLSDLDRRVAKRAKAVAEPVSTPGDAARNLDRLSDVLMMADRALSKLKPPLWAQEQSSRYLRSVRDVTGVLDAGAREFSEAEVTFPEYKAFQAKLNRALRVERKRFRALAKAIGAIPTLPGGGGDEAPAGDESQSA
jgi:hypothetical protein